MPNLKWTQQTAEGLQAINNMLAGAIFVALSFTAMASLPSNDPCSALSPAGQAHLRGALYIVEVTAFGLFTVSSAICQALLAVWRGEVPAPIAGQARARPDNQVANAGQASNAGHAPAAHQAPNVHHFQGHIQVKHGL